MKEKIQKVLARSGLASRREIESWVAAGRVKVNGKVIGLGERVDEQDRIQVDGKPISAKRLQTEAPRVVIYNKPVGEICSRSDPQGRQTVFQKLPHLEHGRWVAIGRLDINTSGLLLFTTDGALANKMMHPSSQIDREYVVRVMGRVDAAMLERLRSGVMLEDGMANFTDLAVSKNADDDNDAINQWYYCTLMEGRNREVRRLWESQGLKVSRLKRVRYGPVLLPSKARRGQWVEMESKIVKQLYQALELEVPATLLQSKRNQQKQNNSRRSDGLKQGGLKQDRVKQDRTEQRRQTQPKQGSGRKVTGRKTVDSKVMDRKMPDTKSESKYTRAKPKSASSQNRKSHSAKTPRKKT